MPGKGKGKTAEPMTTKRSRSARAGLQFPVGKFNKRFRSPKSIETKACPVVRAALAEYIAAELLELAGNAARDNRKQRITRRWVSLAVLTDVEFKQVFGTTSIIGGSKPLDMMPQLLPSKKGKSGKRRKRKSFASTEDEEGAAVSDNDGEGDSNKTSV